MQYVGRAIGSVSKTWSSINPATLSGAIDIIVVEHEDGQLYCSPFHVRFGKFQLLRPSDKKVDFIVNGKQTNIPMKLGDGGEAFFVFETDADVPKSLQTSPVASRKSSPEASPKAEASVPKPDIEPDYLDINEKKDDDDSDSKMNDDMANLDISDATSLEKARRLSSKLTRINIPSTVETNGDVLLDIHGYKSDDKDNNKSDQAVRQLLREEFGPDVNYNALINKDLSGNIRISGNSSDAVSVETPPNPIKSTTTSEPEPADESDDGEESSTVHFRTLRLTSEQLKCLSLKYGQNDVQYSVNQGKSVITAKLYLWKWNVPIVISDIDGTITKSDTLGHFFTMLGKDWTHEGVARLFSDISNNGYNIMYLTARSVGLADMTRSYLTGVEQDGCTLPTGPVILSPDRTIEALKREIVLKKPQVFKMACLNDIEALYFPGDNEEETDPGTFHTGSTDLSDFTDQNTDTGTSEDKKQDLLDENNKNTITGSEILESVRSSKQATEEKKDIHERELKTPFYAGFGNRITDALSYRSVGVPSSRIFTINPDGEVHMELLEMAGYKSSYVSIGELVDQFFPPVNRKMAGIPSVTNTLNQFSDVNFWRNPPPNLSDLSDVSSETTEDDKTQNEASSIGSLSPRIKSFFGGSSPTETNKEPRYSDQDLNNSSEEDDVIEEGDDDDVEEDDEVGEDDDDVDEDPDYVYEDESEEYSDDEDGNNDDDQSMTEEDANPEQNNTHDSISVSPVGLGMVGTGKSKTAEIMVDPTNIEGSIIKMQRQQSQANQ